MESRAPERVVAVRVVSGRDQDQVGPVPARDWHAHVLDEREKHLVAAPAWHGKVEREPLCVAFAHVLERAGAGPEQVLVDAAEEHLARAMEDRVRAVAVMHVPVEHEDPLGAERVERVPRRHRHVREQAEAHRPRVLGVVSRRAQRQEARALAAPGQRLHRRAGAARRPQRRLVGAGTRGGVRVERGRAGAHLGHEGDVLRRVNREQLLLARPRRLARLPAERRSRSTRLGRVRAAG